MILKAQVIIRSILTLGFLPSAWRTPAFGMLGVAAGLALVIVRISEFPTYLSDNPRTCINCHVMVPQFVTWEKSSHAEVAKCNDCHVPHDSIIRKYAFKATDGMRHSAIFAIRAEPQVIRARHASMEVIQENCLRCHERQLSRAHLLASNERKCIDCHRDMPHGDRGGLSATPNPQFPHLPRVTDCGSLGLMFPSRRRESLE